MFKTLTLSLLTAFATSIATTCAFNLCINRQAVAFVDVASITSGFITREAKKNHSNHEKQQAIQTFSHSLEKALQTLSKSKNLVLLPKEASIKGGHDCTDEVRALMLKEMPS